LNFRPRILILDIEPLLIDWKAPDGAWSLRPEDLLDAVSGSGVQTLRLVSNSRRSFAALPEGLADNLVMRAWKPWTSLRRLRLDDAEQPGVVCGDVSLTDGLLAARLGFVFVHLEIDRRPLYPALQDFCGPLLRRRAQNR